MKNTGLSVTRVDRPALVGRLFPCAQRMGVSRLASVT